MHTPSHRWPRVVLKLDRKVDSIARLAAALRDEAMRGLVPLDARDELTRWVFGQNEAYAPGGYTFQMGLFDWEDEALSTPPFPPRGRVLLGGAGGGRELVALCQRGYEVTAFEPSAPLAAHAIGVAQPFFGAHVVRASYGDLAGAARNGDGPLGFCAREAPFDAVVFGWASLAHVLDDEARTSALLAARHFAPTAPLLVSGYSEGDETAPGRAGRAALVLRAVLLRLGAPGARDEKARFAAHTGFYRRLGARELRELADASGYDVVRAGELPCPHAILLPQR